MITVVIMVPVIIIAIPIIVVAIPVIVTIAVTIVLRLVASGLRVDFSRSILGVVLCVRCGRSGEHQEDYPGQFQGVF